MWTSPGSGLESGTHEALTGYSQGIRAVLESAYEHLQYSSSELEHRYGDGVHILSEPCLITQLARLCEPGTCQPEVNHLIEFCYRGLLERIINLEFPRTTVTRDTRMIENTDRGRFHGEILDPATAVVTVDIARAGTFPSHICFQMLNELIDPARVRQREPLAAAQCHLVEAGDGCTL